jgi:FkbM family methyltransferase
MSPKSLINRILGRDPNMAPHLSYALDGEDLILDHLLEGKANGFYVDVGAHHPARFSNTYLFYRRGWRGINIDAQPFSMALFKKLRPRDINLEVGVDVQAGTLSYFQFNEPALNTFSETEAALKDRAPYRLIGTLQVKVERLDALLARHMPIGQEIDFLNIDVEGKDAEVLHSNDWSRYRPRFVLAETLRTDMLRLGACPVVRFMRSVGYTPVSKAYNTSFFARETD